MKKELMIKRGETLAEWCERLAKHYDGKVLREYELKEVLHELSVKSYCHGSNDAIQAIKNPLRKI